MRHLTNLIAMAFMGLMIAGCTGECEDPEAASCTAETDVDTDTDTDSDTDTDADADMATLSVGGTINGVPEACQVECFGPQNYEIDTATESPVNVEAGQYTCTIGGTDICGGVPCHPDSNGVQRVSPELGVDLAPNESGSLSFPLGVYFVGKFECTASVWGYNESAPDFKGTPGSTTVDTKQQMEVTQGFKITASVFPDFRGLTGDSGNYLFVANNAEMGDYIDIEEVGDIKGRKIYTSSITETSWMVSVVRKPNKVTDYSCVLKP